MVGCIGWRMYEWLNRWVNERLIDGRTVGWMDDNSVGFDELINGWIDFS